MSLRHIAIAALLAMLSGCAGLNHIHRTDQQVAASHKAADATIDNLRGTRPSEVNDAVHIYQHRQYIDTRPVMASKYQQLDAHTKCDITFSPAKGLTLLETGEFISRWCGVQVRVTPDALADPTSNGSSNNAAPSGPAAPNQAIPLPTGVSLPPGVGNSQTSMADRLVDIRYTGPLAGFLDALTARFGLSWRVSDRSVVIYRYETRIFRIYNLPTTLDMTSKFTSGTVTTSGVSGGAQGSAGGGASGGAGGMSAGSGSNQSTTVALQTDPAKDLTAAIAAMTSANGHHFYSASTGSLVVTDTPEVLRRVGAYVDQLNQGYSKQALLNLSIIQVTLTKKDHNNLNWSVVYKNAERLGATLANTYTATNGAVTGSINILSGNSHWSGTQALVSALSTQGDVRVLTEPSIIARNLKPSPIQIANQTGFIAQASNTISSGTGGFSQSSLTPGTVTTGVDVWAMPMIYPDNKTLELSLSLNLSDLISILRKQSGDTAIEVPEIAYKKFSPDVTLRSGDTAVIAAFRQNSVDNERSGVGSAHNWLLGGGIDGSRKSVYIVIAVTPVILHNAIPAPTPGLADE